MIYRLKQVVFSKFIRIFCKIEFKIEAFAPICIEKLSISFMYVLCFLRLVSDFGAFDLKFQQVNLFIVQLWRHLPQM